MLIGHTGWGEGEKGDEKKKLEAVWVMKLIIQIISQFPFSPQQTNASEKENDKYAIVVMGTKELW